jgi:hypothetical protein
MGHATHPVCAPAADPVNAPWGSQCFPLITQVDARFSRCARTRPRKAGVSSNLGGQPAPYDFQIQTARNPRGTATSPCTWRDPGGAGHAGHDRESDPATLDRPEAASSVRLSGCSHRWATTPSPGRIWSSSARPCSALAAESRSPRAGDACVRAFAWGGRCSAGDRSRAEDLGSPRRIRGPRSPVPPATRLSAAARQQPARSRRAAVAGQVDRWLQRSA